MRIVGQRVQEQVGQARARQMFVTLHIASEYDAVRRNASTLCFSGEIPLYRGIAFEEPKDASFVAPKKAHPDVEKPRRNLEIVVEAAKHEPILRQIAIRSRES